MTYKRRPGQSHIDLANAKAFEEEVKAHLPKHVHVRTESTVDLDFFVPPIVVEVKEKRQKLTERWWGSSGYGEVIEPFLFVLDELTVRKALKHWPYVWFVLRDVPAGAIYLASLPEILSLDRHRFNRNGKGKWVVDTAPLRKVQLEDIMNMIRSDVRDEAWKASCCMVPAPEV